jgi:hypothetical protein
MATQRRQRSRQAELFRRSVRPIIALDENHRLVVMTEEIDWTALWNSCRRFASAS